MAESIPCPGCRSPIAVPAGHAEPTARCGICWTEVPVGPRPRPAPSAARPLPAVPLPAKPAAPGGLSKPGLRVADALPAGGRPAAGMAPLEALIHKANARLAPAAPKPAIPTAIPVPPDAPPRPAKIPVAAIVAPGPAAAPTPVALPLPANSRSDGNPRPRADDDPAPTPRRRRDEDEEDDGPPVRRRRPNAGVLAVAATAGAVVLAGLLIGGYVLFSRFLDGSPPPKADMAAAARPADAPAPGTGNAVVNAANPLPPFQPPRDEAAPFAARPGPARPPVQPFPAPAWPAGGKAFPDEPWQPVADADGFEAKLPGRMTVFRTWQENVHDTANFLTVARGRKYIADDKGFHFEITYVDAPAGSKPGLRKMCELPAAKPADVVPAKVGGHDGFECARQTRNMAEVKRVAQVGGRVFVLHARLMPMFGRTPDDVDAAKKTFFDSFTITLDPDR